MVGCGEEIRPIQPQQISRDPNIEEGTPYPYLHGNYRVEFSHIFNDSGQIAVKYEFIFDMESRGKGWSRYMPVNQVQTYQDSISRIWNDRVKILHTLPRYQTINDY